MFVRQIANGAFQVIVSGNMWEVYGGKIVVRRSGRARMWVRQLIGWLEEGIRFACQLGFAASSEIRTVLDLLPPTWSGLMSIAERAAAVEKRAR